MIGSPSSGVINIKKDKGMTSHDVVASIRRLLGTKKVGHTGTLDPDVEGVLPICFGKATRIAEYLLDFDKSYTGRVRLGSKTDSQDASGEIIVESDYIPTFEQIQSIKENYIGKIQQIPPMYSSVKHKGRRLHELARKGREIERKARQVEIYELSFFNYNYPQIDFECSCSKGTYIRTLMNDIGAELSCYAHLLEMTRKEVEHFQISDSYSLTDLAEMIAKDDYSFVIGVDQALKKYPKIFIEDDKFDKVINGVRIDTKLKESDELHLIYCAGEFIGTGRVKNISGQNKIVVEKMLYPER